MKHLFVFLTTALVVLFLINQSQAIDPRQLGHQTYGAISERIAVKIGTNLDTVFVSTGSNVKAFQVPHLNPTNATSLGYPYDFSVTGHVNAIAVVDSTVLVAHSNGLDVRDYKNNIDYISPNWLSTNITDVVINSNPAKDTIAYISFSGGFAILSIAHLPTNNVTNLSIQSIPGFTINALAHRNRNNTAVDTLFLAGDGPQGVRRYEITNNVPALIASSTESWNSHFTDIAVGLVSNMDSIYVAEADSGYRAFKSDSSGIASTGRLQPIPNTTTKNLSIVQDTLLVTSSMDGFRIFKLWWANEAQLTPIPIVIGSSFPYESVKGYGNLLYFAFGIEGLQTYDISVPTAPAIQGNGFPTAFLVHDVAANEGFAFIANGGAGVRIIDLMSHNDIGGSPYKWSSGMYYNRVLLKDDFLYAFWDTGFDIVNISNPLSPVLVNSVTPGIAGLSDADLIKIPGTTDSTFIITAINSGIKIFNVTNPLNVTTVGAPIMVPGGCTDVQIINRRLLYGAPGPGSLWIWDISDIFTPVLRDSVNNLPNGKFAAWDTSYAYYLKGDSVLKIDARDKGNLTSVGSVYGVPGDHWFTSITLAGNFMHLGVSSMFSNQIHVVNLNATPKPAVIDSYFVQDQTCRLTIAGLSLFTASNIDGWYHFGDKFGAARVVLGKVSGMPKDSVTIPVRVIDNLTQLGALSFEMFFPFDTNYVKFVSVIRGAGNPVGYADTLSQLTTVTHSFSPSPIDTLKVVHADTMEIPGASIAGQDTLLKIKFRIKDTAPVQPLLQSTPIAMSHLLFSEGFPVATMYGPGRIIITPRFGDANQDGKVSASDASYILQSVIGLVGQPSLILADVSNNSEVRAYDAALILKRIVNPAFKYPVEMYYGLKQATAPLNKDIKIQVTSENSGTQSEKTAEVNTNSMTYGISMKNVREVWSIEMVIDLGKGQKFMRYKLSPLSEEMSVQYRQEGTMLYISMASGTSVTKDGKMLELICQVTDPEQVKPIDIQQFILNESLIENIEGTLSGIPKTFALEQNYPNPFNPVTEIKYQLSNAGKITLAIYNILGQQVKILVNSTQSAGYYTVKWDGKDATGINVASGVYFYRIQTSGFVKTRKMMYLK